MSGCEVEANRAGLTEPSDKARGMLAGSLRPVQDQGIAYALFSGRLWVRVQATCPEGLMGENTWWRAPAGLSKA